MWERGLKQCGAGSCRCIYQSLPMWERGLKPPIRGNWTRKQSVAPHVGAWIETGKEGLR